MGQTLPIVGESAGSGMLIAAPFTGPGAPFVAAAGALTLLFTKIFGRPDTAELLSSQIVDQAEPHFQANLQAYQSGQLDKTTALSNFDSMWASVVQAESDPRTMNHGAIAVSDRSPGGKWDWFSYYRTPIEQGADVSTTDAILSNATLLGSSGDWIWLAVIAAGLFIVTSGGRER